MKKPDRYDDWLILKRKVEGEEFRNGLNDLGITDEEHEECLKYYLEWLLEHF